MKLHVYVSGRVQGVFFRASTKHMADSLGLRGFVRNLDDGRVEVEAYGDKESLEELLKWLHKGPRWARVDDVQYVLEEESSQSSEYHGFYIRY
ncbi:MAG: acylphosphatase [Promethearchaeota archaeon]